MIYYRLKFFFLKSNVKIKKTFENNLLINFKSDETLVFKVTTLKKHSHK